MVIQVSVILHSLLQRKLIVCATLSCVCYDPIIQKRYKTDNDNGKHFQHRTFASQTVAQKVELLCEGCNRPNHTLERCKNFNSKSSDEKREIILKNGICLSCLKRT